MNYVKTLWKLCLFKQNEKKNRQQMKALQERKLRELLRFAYQNSEYYHKAFEDAGITKENLERKPISAFPTLDKAALFANFDKLVTRPEIKQEELRNFDEQEKQNHKLYLNKYHVVHSSGSTGDPAYFIYDESAWNDMLVGIIRGALWDMSMPQILRFLSEGLRIVYVAATDGRYGGAMAVGDGIDGLGARQIHLDINLPLDEWIRQLNDFRPNVVIGYPSAIKILTELMDKQKVSLRIRRAISCGEPIGASQRHALEKVLGTRIINFYGASESLALGVECDPNDGMLLFDDLNYIEVKDGEMYLTCLYNRVQPLIRYHITDKIILKEPDKNSRYPFIRLDGLVGRDEDLLWFTDSKGRKDFLHPLAMEGFCIKGLRDYQFRQTGDDVFEMYAETTEDADKSYIEKEMLKLMQKILTDKALKYVKFQVHFVEEILPDPKTGKKQLIITK